MFETVADVNCGTGYYAIKLAHVDFKVTATDDAATILEQTKSNTEAMGIVLEDAQVIVWRALSDVYGTKPSSASVTPSPT